MTEIENKTDANNIKELLIEKYPMAESPNLFEYFLIMGYEESYIQEKIIKNFDTKMINQFKEEKTKDKIIEIFDEKKCRNLPTILFSIGSNFSYPMKDEINIIQKVFPVPPSVFYTSIENNIFEPHAINFIFTNIQNVAVYIGYVYIFYEHRIIKEKAKIFVPKAFVIISQYPFFRIFEKMFIELTEQFKKDQIQIPIEIQLYNIVNFIPAPINENINVTFFPSCELYDIIMKCKSDLDLIELNKKKQEYSLKQLSGYRQSEIDLSSILYLFPVEVIIKTYLELLTGHTIAVFSSNISRLNSTIYIFQQLFYPLNHDESVVCVSPVRYFCAEYLTQNILGFLCSYNEVNNYDPFRDLKPGENKFLSEEEENENLDPILFGCDFVLDLDKKNLINVDNNNKIENYKEHKYNANKILNLVEGINKGSGLSELENSIKILSDELKELSIRKTMYETNDTLKSQITIEETTTSNKKIQNAFYKFNLDISYQYFKYYSSYNGSYLWDKISTKKKPKTIQESGLTKNDYLFFSLFSEAFYCNILNNFVGGYSKVEPVLYKAPRIIFENFIFFQKLSENESKKINGLDYLDIIDKIYIKEKKGMPKEKNISFLNFYKFYQNNLAATIYDFMDPKYVYSKKSDHIKINIKYLYKYKGINLDKNLLMEYIYILENLSIEEKSKLFNIEYEKWLEYKPINQTITYINIINTFEDYFIDIKYFEAKDVIKLSILNILALSIRNKTLFPYIFTVYSLFDYLSISARKYIEIILSISLRLLKKEKNPNFYVYEKYFNLYQISIDSKSLFPNDQLIYLKKEINSIKSNQNLNDCNNLFDERYEKIKDKTKLFTLKYKSNKKAIETIKNVTLNDNIPFKMSFDSKIYTKNKNMKLNELYSPKTIYNITKNMLDIYYKDLDFSKINYSDYEKSIINLIAYTDIFGKDFPKDINNFLFYCLEL